MLIHTVADPKLLEVDISDREETVEPVLTVWSVIYWNSSDEINQKAFILENSAKKFYNVTKTLYKKCIMHKINVD